MAVLWILLLITIFMYIMNHILRFGHIIIYDN